VGAVALELLCLPGALVHGSHPFVAFRHSSDERAATDVTAVDQPRRRGT
jgi:hypothetical protein